MVAIGAALATQLTVERSKLPSRREIFILQTPGKNYWYAKIMPINK
jgi:hypothetical protein